MPLSHSIGITDSALLISGSIAVKSFPDLKYWIGLDGCCFLYAGFSLFAIFWGAWSIPDNRGKSLVKVEEQFENPVGNKKEKY